jgi:hypothetical protein
MLAERRHDREARRASNHLLVDDVREAFEDEAHIVVAESDLDFAEARRGRRIQSASSPEREGSRTRAEVDDDDALEEAEPDLEPRPEPEVAHRFDRRRRRASTDAPRRMIVLRDRRRGRRPPKHGSDPPAE